MRMPGPSDTQLLGSNSAETQKENYILDCQIGRGAYGSVWKARHKLTGIEVAIKCIDTHFDRALTCIRALREIMLLAYFDHPNIVRVLDLPQQTPSAIHIVQELFPFTLYDVLARGRKDKECALLDDQCECLMYQLIAGLNAIHSANVLHRDIKPANLLVNEECDLKICDFGLAREERAYQRDEFDMTTYVATRWYRAPEIIIQDQGYTRASDVWSAGCVFAEMLGGKVFLKGKTTLHQLELICKKVGAPTQVQHPLAREWLHQLPKQPAVDVASQFPKAPSDAVALLKHLLVSTPSGRLTAEAALRHNYFTSFYDEADVSLSAPLDKGILWFDRENYRRRKIDDAKMLLNSELEWIRAAVSSD